ncbi:signal recognition particle-docking protein FtsY [Thalassotalea sp. G20_0]|uniref:signal recognition particle-docking protein FtsY n=1 Tax=Thalassotalea sp. G20_0 TaxID=2821093 RepID=UPI001ADAE896|nr:signal recognition particle-docking protein FtsY [Thalassotalea sp. G20_0]MBO9495198.1 signal recognition particle-docking protein FtsY [Thalassotalea sp. G20_0]
MFGSRKDDEKKAKRSFWPWGRRSRDEVSEEQVEAKAEPEVEDVVSTVETPEVTAESSAGVDAAPETVPEVVQGPEDKPVHPESREESAHKAPEASDKEVPVVAVPEIPRAAEPESLPEKTPVEPENKPETKGGFFSRMRQGLSKTRNVLVEGVAELFIGKKEIDDDLLDELETQLLVADVGVEATTDIIEKLTRKVKYKELDDADALMTALQSELADILEPADQPLVIPKQDTPFVILVVGVNGVGKTTTIGKLARKLQSEGRKVMLAAGDTFRAAAVEQLQVWGERNEIPVVAQHTGADSASVIFDAFEAARARNIDVLIADTAGRLHNKDHLMEELKKVKRVLGKLDPDAPHEVLLVLDAGTGQNALSQARLFHEAVQLTGMALTKLDGTAKGGVIFALSKQMKLPIRFLGVGEQIDDLRPFSAKEFVTALFSREG